MSVLPARPAEFPGRDAGHPFGERVRRRISHQLTTDISRRFQETDHIGFPVLEDNTGDVAVQFGIRWASDDLRLIQEHLGTNLVLSRRTEPCIIPMQARYVIGRDGVIAFAEVAFD